MRSKGCYARPCSIGAVLLVLLGWVCSAEGGSLIAEDFEAMAADDGANRISSFAGDEASAQHAVANEGTIDSYRGRPGHCAELKATVAGKERKSIAGVRIRSVMNSGAAAELTKLNLSADVWVDRVQPVAVTISSLDSAGQSTGTLGGEVFPPVAGAWFRHSLDLPALKKVAGNFDPLARQMSVAFELRPSGTDGSSTLLRIDNLSVSSPSFYISENGNDKADGRSEATAFATIQRGVDAAQPGDVVLIMNGTYRNTTPAGLVSVSKKGSPAKWITIRSYPGHAPRLINDGWEVFKIIHGSAYLEIRGLEIIGNRKNVKLEDALADGAVKEKDGIAYPGDPRFNGNGISAEGRQSPTPAERPHHLRFINNHVHDNSGAGLSAIACDYVTFEGNHIHDNANFMRYGGSGMSMLLQSNFDDSTAHRSFIFNNIARNNRCYVPWIAVGKMSDGNAIIVDVNINKTDLPDSYHGRTLVANNLCIGSGGAGIAVTTSKHVDIVNNTLYHNVQTDDLAKRGWGELQLGGPPPNCEDVRIFNNIIWAAPGRAIITANRINDWICKNNIYFGDAGAKLKAGDAGDEGNVVVNPKLKSPSLEAPPDDFLPMPGSPAIGHGSSAHAGVQLLDLDGKPRPMSGPITAGAFQRINP